MPVATSTIVALDVGARRIGVAVADSVARLARPLTTLERSSSTLDELQHIIAEQKAEVLIVGLPRDMAGQTTQQTRDTLEFVAELKTHLNVPIHMQDEAVTSKHAEAELKTRGKTYNKGDIDALAATYILDDWLQANVGVMHG